MLKKLLLAPILFIAVFASCTKDDLGGTEDRVKTPGESGKLSVNKNFSWTTQQRATATLSAPSSVYSVDKQGNKSLLAEELPAGTYDFTIAYGSTLQVTESTAKMQARAKGYRNIYYPSPDGWVMLIVEDVFPYTGDLDMNDIVVDFRVKYELNENNQPDVYERHVRAVEITFKSVALGGTLYEKMGLALNFINDKMPNGVVKNVSGQVLTNNMFTVKKNGKGTGSEDGSIVPLTDDLRSFFPGSREPKGIINTINGLPNLASGTVTVRIELQGDVRLKDVQMEPGSDGNMMDLFVTLGERGREVHLKGHPATAKLNADLQQYGSYASDENWVWALVMPREIEYPKESCPIYEAYPLFREWTAGKLKGLEDWMYDKVPENIYSPR